MEPELKERVILVNSTYLLVVIFIAAASYVLYMEMKPKSVADIGNHNEQKETNTLTKEEFEKELNLFTEKSTPKEIIVIENKESSNSKSQIITEEEGIRISQSQGYDPKQNIDRTNSDSFIVNVADGENISVTVTENDSNNIFLNAEGFIYAINTDSFVLSKSDDSGFVNVTINKNTKFIINGKNISFNELKIGQKLSIDGYGSIGNIQANTVNVVGFIKAIPN